jgi:hypothetical protein
LRKLSILDILSADPRYFASSGLDLIERSTIQKTFERKTPCTAFDRCNARLRDSSEIMSASIISKMKCDKSVELSGLTSRGVADEVLDVERQFPSPKDVKIEARGPE